jgi:hypothetical protein
VPLRQTLLVMVRMHGRTSHTVPHAPQLPVSVLMLTQFPPQFVYPALQPPNRHITPSHVA